MKSPSVRKWEEIYDSRIEQMNRDYHIDDWSLRSEDYSESRKTDNYLYGRTVLDTLCRNKIVTPSSRVIEIGSGPGTFLVPFAGKVTHFTAIEPATGMISKIKENSRESGVVNYDILPSLWQEVDTSLISKSYDLAISSTVIWMFRDILEQIRRMEEVSSEYCCLCAGIEAKGQSGKNEDLWDQVVGNKPKPIFPEYPLIYSILYENGIYPEVRIIEHYSRRSPENMMKMHSVFYNLFTDLTPEKEDIIQRNVYGNLEDGKYVMRFKTAVLWWKT